MLSGWKKKLLNLVFGSKMGTHRNETNGENCNLEHSEIRQKKTPADSKVTSSLGLSSKNLLE